MKNILSETNLLLNKYKIQANKSLGQNFLIDETVIEKIVDSADINNQDLVIEIGPGLGTLTQYLLEKAKKVICVELDKRMIEILNDRFNLYDNFNIINQDILKVNLQEIIKKEKEKKIKNVKIVANLPYYITTPIIMKILEEKLDIESITVMIQKEVAERLIAIPGQKNTGAITYAIYYYCTSERILEVPNSSFVPKPDVTSEVIKLNIRREKMVDIEDEEKMFKVIKNAFMQRRKTLLNALSNAKIFKNKEQGIEILEKLHLNINVRPENLSINDYVNITNYINNNS